MKNTYELTRNSLLFAAAVTTAGLAGNAAALDIVLYDGVNGDNFYAPPEGPGGFDFSDFTGQTVDTGSSLIIDTMTDLDSRDGLFGGLGRDLDPIPSFDSSTHNIRIEYRLLGNNEANNFRFVFVDDDQNAAGAAEDWQYYVDPSFATPLDDGSGFMEQFVPLGLIGMVDDPDDAIVFRQIAFGAAADGDMIPNYDLRQWQIQSEFNNPLPLHLEVRLVEVLGPSDGLSADFNDDGIVDLLDLDILGGNWQMPGDGTTGDATGDGVVDLLDLDALGSQWQQSGSFEAALAASGIAVPEPASALALLLGAGLFARRRQG